MPSVGRVKIELDKDALARLQGSLIDALELTATEVLTDIRGSQVVPKDTGRLEESGFVDDLQLKEGKAAVVFDTPYSRRLYWHPEYNFRTDKNPNAQGRWMDMYLPGGAKEKFIRKTFMKFWKQLSKGLIK